MPVTGTNSESTGLQPTSNPNANSADANLRAGRQQESRRITNLFASDGSESAPRAEIGGRAATVIANIDTVGDEPNATIGQQAVDSPGVCAAGRPDSPTIAGIAPDIEIA